VWIAVLLVLLSFRERPFAEPGALPAAVAGRPSVSEAAEAAETAETGDAAGTRAAPATASAATAPGAPAPR
jgi:hypothetical protein